MSCHEFIFMQGEADGVRGDRVVAALFRSVCRSGRELVRSMRLAAGEHGVRRDRAADGVHA
jgi:hypothetical protein